jgi:tRNA(fMet)-specific endonuclease VapC
MIILDTSFLIDFFRSFFSRISILDYDLNAAEKSSEIMATLLSSGKAVNALDALIAGIAIANGADKIATRDGDFEEISKIAKLEVQVY